MINKITSLAYYICLTSIFFYQNTLQANPEIGEQAEKYAARGQSVLTQQLDKTTQELYAQDAEFIKQFPYSEYKVVDIENQGKYLIDTVNDSIKNTLRDGQAWEPENDAIIKLYAKEGSIAVDIGAHVGTHVMTMSKAVGINGQVIAFEPNKDTYRELCANMALNECANVIPVRCAVGKDKGTVEVVTPVAHNQGGTYCVPKAGGSKSAAIIPLDSLNLNNVSFIKIDVENAELDVLEGATETIKRNRPILLVEVQGNGDRTRDLNENTKVMKEQSLSKLISLGYSFQQLGNSCDYLATPDTDKEIDLSKYERSMYSQNGEDGVLDKIFQTIGVDSKYFVEFGGFDGITTSNAHFHREAFGWTGLQLDGGHENLALNLRKEFITAENINDIFAKYNVPDNLDLLSIDIDYNDFYVWKALSDQYNPRVVVIEYNASHLPTEDKVVAYLPDYSGAWNNYFGASIKAYYNLGRTKGYSLVYAEKMGVNLFFVRDEILEGLKVKFKNINDVEKIYREPKYGWGPRGGHPQDPENRDYLSSEDLLK